MESVYTMEKIRSMSDEEVESLNRKMSKKVLQKFAIFVGIKVLLFVWIRQLTKSWRESK